MGSGKHETRKYKRYPQLNSSLTWTAREFFGLGLGKAIFRRENQFAAILNFVILFLNSHVSYTESTCLIFAN